MGILGSGKKPEDVISRQIKYLCDHLYPKDKRPEGFKVDISARKLESSADQFVVGITAPAAFARTIRGLLRGIDCAENQRSNSSSSTDGSEAIVIGFDVDSNRVDDFKKDIDALVAKLETDEIQSQYADVLKIMEDAPRLNKQYVETKDSSFSPALEVVKIDSKYRLQIALASMLHKNDFAFVRDQLGEFADRVVQYERYPRTLRIDLNGLDAEKAKQLTTKAVAAFKKLAALQKDPRADTGYVEPNYDTELKEFRERTKKLYQALTSDQNTQISVTSAKLDGAKRTNISITAPIAYIRLYQQLLQDAAFANNSEVNPRWAENLDDGRVKVELSAPAHLGKINATLQSVIEQVSRINGVQDTYKNGTDRLSALQRIPSEGGRHRPAFLGIDLKKEGDEISAKLAVMVDDVSFAAAERFGNTLKGIRIGSQFDFGRVDTETEREFGTLAIAADTREKIDQVATAITRLEKPKDPGEVYFWRS